MSSGFRIGMALVWDRKFLLLAFLPSVSIYHYFLHFLPQLLIFRRGPGHTMGILSVSVTTRVTRRREVRETVEILKGAESIKTLPILHSYSVATGPQTRKQLSSHYHIPLPHYPKMSKIMQTLVLAAIVICAVNSFHLEERGR